MAETELLVCVKCRRGQEADDDTLRPGQRLYNTLSQQQMPQGVRLRAVECLSNCSDGCTVALRGGNRWTYVYGNLDVVEHLDMLPDYAAQYHATPDGLIPWRERPEHIKRNCVARIPPLDYIAPNKETDQ